MKYLIAFVDNSQICNRVIACDSIEEAIQDQEDNYGLDYYPIINVFELSDKFNSTIEE